MSVFHVSVLILHGCWNILSLKVLWQFHIQKAADSEKAYDELLVSELLSALGVQINTVSTVFVYFNGFFLSRFFIWPWTDTRRGDLEQNLGNALYVA